MNRFCQSPKNILIALISFLGMNGTVFSVALESVSDTKFDPDRGFYTVPFRVNISTATPGATVRYTVDGSVPSLTNGYTYDANKGIEVATTTIIRAAGFLEGLEPTNVDTHTYLFLSDVVHQPQRPEGFPTNWTGWDYGMEDEESDLIRIAGLTGDMATATQAREQIAESLMNLPTLSLTMAIDDWFGARSGIYFNSQEEGRAWERSCSVEWILPPGLGQSGGGFQVDCGVRMQGFTSRNASSNPKHSLRLLFRGEYGAAKLEYPLFAEEGPRSFDTIVLRSNSQDAWVYDTSSNRDAQFVRDEWARLTHRAMGQVAARSSWVHLYINGLYWGVYNPTERPDASFSAAHFGGSKEDYDAVKNHEEVLDGNIDAYLKLLSWIQNNPNNWNMGYRDLSGASGFGRGVRLLDLEMMIDYMIHNMYAAATDWPGNFYMGYDRTENHGGWKFYDWDNEHGMKNDVNINRTVPHSRDADSPTKFHHALRVNPEYRMRFADRLHRAFFNGGPLYVDPDHPEWDPSHPERNRPAARWMELTGEIEQALIAESARWGDYRRTQPYTVHEDFQNVRNDLLQNWFPYRSEIVLSQFRAQGLYPSVYAPQFSKYGGVVEPGFGLAIRAPRGGVVYFTEDGADPRNSSATIYTEPIAVTESTAIRARVQLNGEWSAMTEADFFVGVPASRDTLAISEIMYKPILGDEHEYLELMNISETEPIDLTGAQFTDGIDFVFQNGSVLAPLERAVIAKNVLLFRTVYDTHNNIRVLGEYGGVLNNGGERIALRGWNGSLLLDFEYDDQFPWPTSPDREGNSLTLVAPQRKPDPGEASNWRPSVLQNGSPGFSDAEHFEGNPEADIDQDGLTALLEYAYGSLDVEAANESKDYPVAHLSTEVDKYGIKRNYLEYIFQRNLAAEDLEIVIEQSEDLIQWEPAVDRLLIHTDSDHTAGRIGYEKYRTIYPVNDRPRLFLRLRILSAFNLVGN